MDAPNSPRRNFMWMSLYFSITHACCTTPLIYATTLLGDQVGDIGNGILYIVNIVCSMVIAVQFVNKISLKGGLLSCQFLFLMYEGSFTIALLLGAKHQFWLFSILGSLSGGLAAGIGWVAQGGYLSRSATLVADSEGIPRDVATSELASMFAFVYLTLEVLAKAIYSLLLVAHLTPFVISIIYFGVSALSFGMTARIDTITMEPPANNSIFTKSFRCILLWRNPHIWLLSAINFTFGISAALMNGHVNSHFAHPNVVGFLSAMTGVVAAFCTLFLGPISRAFGKGPCLAMGSASFLALAVTLLATNDAHRWGWEIIVLYFLQGSGRAVYESTNKAIFADVFTGEDTEAAFANCFLQQAASAAFCFFFLASNTQNDIQTLNVIQLVLTLSIVPFYTISFYLRQRLPEETPLVSKKEKECFHAA